MGHDAVKLTVTDALAAQPAAAQPASEAEARRQEIRRRVTLAVEQIRALPRA